MLYPPVATQLPSNVSNSIRRFDFLERNNNTQGVNKHNISQHNSSSADVESLMTAGANISVVTANNAATLPYTASEDRASTGDDLSPSSVIKMDSSGTPIGVVTSDDCSGVMGESGSPTPPQTLTLRLIMQGKEVGSIIGKRGDTIKKFRTESGARINISDGQSIERIVTLTGASECLNKAFAMISYKFEEDMSEGLTADCPKPPVTLRLIVPASQCGSIIGKGGSKIKEIREHTGCTIQVAGDYLPQSTERAVTISGMPEAITKCIMEICKIMSESPPKGQTLPYRPKPISSMVAGSPIIANTHPAAAHHPFAAASPNFSSHAVAPGMTGNNFFTSAAYGIHPAHHAQFLPSTQNELAKLQAAQLSSLYGSFLQPATMMQLGASPLMGHAAATPLSPSSAGSASGGASHSSSTTQELNIPNDVIGCVIGPHGNRINDIRNSSGASIKISPMSENSGPNRVVTVTGTAEAVNNAWLQIATSLGLDPASLAAGMFSSSGNQAAVLSANPALAAAAGLSANQILAQLQLMNSGLPWASIASAVPSSSVSFSNPMMGLMSQAQAGNYSANYAHNPQVAAAVSSGSNLVNVMRPNFTNLKKARSEAAPY